MSASGWMVLTAMPARTTQLATPTPSQCTWHHCTPFTPEPKWSVNPPNVRACPFSAACPWFSSCLPRGWELSGWTDQQQSRHARAKFVASDPCSLLALQSLSRDQLALAAATARN
eukprot:4300-Rhodomonas_salina.2